MKLIVKYSSVFLLVLSLILLPVYGIGYLFGLAGSTSEYFKLIRLGYLGILISSSISIFYFKFFPAIIISLIVIITGVTYNNSFWADHNRQLCNDLRSDPSCLETECGFSCENFKGMGGFMTGGSICKDKALNSCKEKAEQSNRSTKITDEALSVYSNIVDAIIESDSSENEDFENHILTEKAPSPSLVLVIVKPESIASTNFRVIPIQMDPIQFLVISL